MKTMIGTCCAIALSMPLTYGALPLVERASAQAKPASTRATQQAQSASKQEEGDQKSKQSADKGASGKSNSATAHASSNQNKNDNVVWGYTYYGIGYDDAYDNDSFYDYYVYDDGPYAAYYPDYTYDYDWDADLFDWEEDGLFQ